jgi:hypothetical protein
MNKVVREIPSSCLSLASSTHAEITVSCYNTMGLSAGAQKSGNLHDISHHSQFGQLYFLQNRLEEDIPCRRILNVELQKR